MVLSDIIAAAGSILVARLLGSTNYGIYGVSAIPISIISLFSNWGLGTAAIRFIAQCRAQGRTEEAKGIFFTGMLAGFLIGIFFTLVAFVAAPFMAIQVFNKPELMPLIQVSSVTLLANSLLVSSQAIYIGFDRAEFSSLAMFLTAVTKALISPALIVLGYGVLGAVIGSSLGPLVSSMVAVLVVYLALWRPLRKNGATLNFFRNLKRMIRYSFPLFISMLLGGALGQIYSFLMALYCTEFMIGNYKAATNFSVLIAFLATPIATVLFPAFSQLDHRKEADTLRIVFQNSVKYTALVTLPVVAALIILAQPIIQILFGPGYELTPLYLALYALTNVFIGVGGVSIGNLINSQGETKLTLMLNVIALLTGVPLSLYLIPRFQIEGLLVAMILGGIPSLVAGILWVKKYFGLTLDLFSSARIYAATAVSAVLTFLLISWLKMGDVATLLVGGFLFLFLYTASIFLTRAIGRSDIRNLREALRGLGPLFSLFNPILTFAEKILDLLSRVGL
jgi:stage V sporulation protein B